MRWTTRDYGWPLLTVHALVVAFGVLYAFGFLVRPEPTPDGATGGEVTLSVFIAVFGIYQSSIVLKGYLAGEARGGVIPIYMLAHMVLLIMGYATMYSVLPYGGTLNCQPNWLTDLYFSVVTFTTLGYGDCAPIGPTRFFAASQALLSYIFVGIIVGVFAGLRLNDSASQTATPASRSHEQNGHDHEGHQPKNG